MDVINAIAKVRFSSAKPQHVQLHKSQALQAVLICMEAGQELAVEAGQWMYYVVTGSARIAGDAKTADMQAGHMAATERGERHTLANPTDRRTVVLAIQTTGGTGF